MRFAGVSSDLKHYHGRTGMGAVMGSKNLKAVAVRGTGKLAFSDMETLKRLSKWFAENFRRNVDNINHTRFGTSSYYFNAHVTGNLPTRNFTTGRFEGAMPSTWRRCTTVQGCHAQLLRLPRALQAGLPWR